MLNMLHILRFVSSKCHLFHNATSFGSCIIRILHTGCAKIKKISGAKGLIRRKLVKTYCELEVQLNVYANTGA
jgi:hypothetical protein